MALEWGEYNIRVNGIAPGPIADTPGFTKLSGGIDDEAAATMMRWVKSSG
jgi:peroxisomal 2,4-dienoyl-CoA reductase